MTDRLNGVWVAFDRDIRTDDVEPIISAIRCIRGVVAVEGQVADSSEWMARERVRHEVQMKLYEAIREIFDPKKEK